jgi:HK97 family phage major capsid protein
MMQYLSQKIAERDSLTQFATEVTERAAREERDLTDTERQSLSEWSQRCGELDAQLAEVNTQAESVRSYAKLRAELEERNAEPEPSTNGSARRPHPGGEAKSWGQAFVESVEFRAYNGHGQSAPFAIDGYLETRAAITTANLSIPHFVLPPVEQQFISRILGVCGRVTVSSGVVDWVEIGADPVAAVVAEGAAKPEAAVTFTPKTASLDTIAHWVQITRQALEDASYIRSLLEGKLRRGLLAKAEADMATAIDTAATQTASTSTAGGGNLLKSIRVGIGKVESAGYNPNAVLLNPTDYASIDIDVMGTTDTGPVRAATFWGLTPVASNSITAGKAYVGDFASGATLFDRGVTNVFLTDSHASLFISNVLLILAEARLKSVVDEPLAICECTVVA